MTLFDKMEISVTKCLFICMKRLPNKLKLTFDIDKKIENNENQQV